MEWYDLHTIAYELCDEWKQCDEYQAVLHSLSELMADPLAKDAIDHFKAERDRFAQMEAYGKFHPDFKAVSNRFSKAKATLYEHPLFQKYAHHLSVFNGRLENFSREVESILTTCLVKEKSACYVGENHG